MAQADAACGWVSVALIFVVISVVTCEIFLYQNARLGPFIPSMNEAENRSFGADSTL